MNPPIFFASRSYGVTGIRNSGFHHHGDPLSPKDRVVPCPNGRTLWLINGGPILTTYPSTAWDDPRGVPSLSRSYLEDHPSS